MPLSIRAKASCRFDLVALGEVMLRLDPGDARIATTTTLRVAHSTSVNDWCALCVCDGRLEQARWRPGIAIYDRIGGGDSVASGLIYGLLTGRGAAWAVECGAAHGALAMTTPGDTTMATLAEVEKVRAGAAARVER